MKKISLSIMMIVFVVVLNVPIVQATPILTLTTGSKTVTIMDGGLHDSNPAVGVITYIGTVGSHWSVNVTTGITKPDIGSATDPQMDLDSIDVSTGAGTLTIKFSDTGFGPFNGVLTTEVGGTAGNGTVSFDTRANGISLSSIGPLGPGAFAGTASKPVKFSLNSSLELDAIITHTKAGSTSFDETLTSKVPEPGMLLLLGSGIIALAGFKRAVRK